MRGGAGRKALDRAPPPPSDARNPDFTNTGKFCGGGRDSDVSSLCSSRPSIAGATRSALITDRAAQSAALRGVNSYLSAISAPFSLRPPLPSARDIIEALRLLLSRIDFALISSNSNDLSSDLPVVFRALRCPLKLPRSALSAPGTPHSWPPLLSALHWLAQLARYSDLHSDITTVPSSNDLFLYLTRSYSLFISGDDSGVDALDDEYLRKADHQAKNAAAAIESLENTSCELEAKLHALTSEPTRRETLKKKQDLLAEDAKKFLAVVESFGLRVGAMEREIRQWEGELEIKEEEIKRVRDENEELKKSVEGQAVSVRDAERMRREIQAVESDIFEVENAITAMEERALELETAVGRKLKELEVISEQCNQAIRRLKLGNDFQYVLNPGGMSVNAVLGMDYKKTLKPTLNAFADEAKNTSVSKLEELIGLRQQSSEISKMLEEKISQVANFHAIVTESEARLTSLKKEMEVHSSRCAAEAERTREEFKMKEHQLDLVEKEAEQFLKDSEQKLHAAVRESDEDTQMCARELLAVIDMISEYKEYMEFTIAGMRQDMSETTNGVAEAYKASLSAKQTSSGLI